MRLLERKSKAETDNLKVDKNKLCKKSLKKMTEILTELLCRLTTKYHIKKVKKYVFRF